MFGLIKIRERDKIKALIRKFLDNKENKTLFELLKDELPNKTDEEINKIIEEIELGNKRQIEVYEKITKEELKGKSYESVLAADIIESYEKTDMSKEEVKKELNEVVDFNSKYNSYIFTEIGKDYYNNNEFSSEKEKEDFNNTLNIVSNSASLDHMNSYINNISDTIKSGNQDINTVVHTKSGLINQNPNLDGFIAEQKHVNSFNLNARVAGKDFVASVPPLKPGQTYTKNGYDLVVKNGSGRIVQHYQVKYGATANDTIKMIKSGDYRNQQIIVPKEQLEEVRRAIPNKTIKASISHDGIVGKEFSKTELKELQKQVQEGKLNGLSNNFKNDVNIYTLGKQVARQTITASLTSMGLSMGFTVLKDKIEGKETDVNQMVENAVITGANVAVTTSIAAALKVSVENQYITGTVANYLTDTSIGVIASSSLGIVNNCYKIGTGEISLFKGINNIGKQITSSYAAIETFKFVSSYIKKKIGTGGVIRLLGGIVIKSNVVSAVASVVIGAVASMVSSKVTEKIYEGATKVATTIYKSAVNTIESGVETVKSVAKGSVNFAGKILSSAASAVSSAVSAVKSFVGGLTGWW
ncbi:hypothetical protein [Streptobacillus canis]|uniref:hypothetical protein n=1 Tax=Streptobacillus canis TaxID=2678686 RepID=UPI0012E1888A|nr:hypothetical protein [Streptobacillus canis]